MNKSRKTPWRSVSDLVTLSLLLLFGAFPALAQTETGQITVKASDAQGAVVSGATVTIKSAATGAERTATTNDEGVATVTSLQPGIYIVTVTGGGFAPNEQQAEITVGARLTVEALLSATTKNETVTVVAGQGGVEVNTTNGELSTVVSQKQVVDLPTLTRNPYNLVELSGNVSAGDTANMTMRGTGFAINGQRSSSTNILLDGGENVDAFVAGVGQSVPLDGVQEFRVITSNFSAEYGRASGGVVNVATKSGSNAFHGSLYEFNRLSALASNDFANNAQGIPKGVFTRNQFGYSFGGPIIKDKLFFFSSTEWTRVRSAGDVISIVPTPELIDASNANTKAFFAPYQLVTPINGSVYTVSQVKSLLGLSGSSPFNNLPDNFPAFGQVRSSRATDLGGGTPQNDWQTVDRFDYNLSDKTQMYFRAAFEDNLQPDGTINFSPYAGFNTGQTTRNQNYLFNVTHTFSANFVNQAKVVFNRLNLDQPLGAQPVGPTLYLNDTVAAQLAGFLFRLPGYSATTPGSAIPFGGPQNFLQVYDDSNWTKGNHQFRFGGQFVQIRDNRTFGAYENAVLGLSTAGQTLGSGLDNLVSGQLKTFQVAVFPQGKFPCRTDPSTGARIVTADCTLQTPLGEPNFSRSNRYNEFALYFNDSWKIRPRFTLNLGLRYEYYGTQHNADPSLDSNFYFGPGSTIFQRIQSGQIMLAQNSPIGALWKADPHDFAPRVGFAWDVFGDGRTSVRGGYGMAYERNFGNVTFNVIQNPPNNATVAITSGVDVPAGSLPLSANNLGPLDGSGIAKAFPAVSLRAVNPNIVNAYAHFWSFAVERQVTPTTVASVEYSGSAGRDLYSISNINRAGTGFVYGGDSRLLARLNNNGATSINFRGSDGTSNYGALIASLESRRFRNWGLTFTARYTYSQSHDDLSSTFSESNANFNLGYTDPFNPMLDYGNSDFDSRHRMTLSWIWEVPTPHFTSHAAKYLLGGWEMSGILEARTGTPFTVFDCTNGVQVCPRVVLDGPVSFSGSASNPVADTANRYAFINLSGLHPGAFSDQFGIGADFPPFPSDMSKRNAFRGPGFWNLDAAILKDFRISEGIKLQMRFEAFNAFNHANLFVSGGEAEINTGGTTDAHGNPVGGYVPAFFSGRRNIQIAAKIIF